MNYSITYDSIITDPQLCDCGSYFDYYKTIISQGRLNIFAGRRCIKCVKKELQSVSVKVPTDIPEIFIGMYRWFTAINVTTDFLQECYWRFDQRRYRFNSNRLFYHRNVKGNIIREMVKARLAGQSKPQTLLGLPSDLNSERLIHYARTTRFLYWFYNSFSGSNNSSLDSNTDPFSDSNNSFSDSENEFSESNSEYRQENHYEERELNCGSFPSSSKYLPFRSNYRFEEREDYDLKNSDHDLRNLDSITLKNVDSIDYYESFSSDSSESLINSEPLINSESIKTSPSLSYTSLKKIFNDIERLYIPYTGRGPNSMALNLTFQYLNLKGYRSDPSIQSRALNDLTWSIVRKFGNFNPTYRGLEFITKHFVEISRLLNRSIKMVSVASGLGFVEYWLQIMARCFKFDLTIDCYDAGCGSHDEESLKENAWLLPTIKSANDLVLSHDVLMLAWPPQRNSLAYDVLNKFTGSYLIYVGENIRSDRSCTADLNFHRYLNRFYEIDSVGNDSVDPYLINPPLTYYGVQIHIYQLR